MLETERLSDLHYFDNWNLDTGKAALTREILFSYEIGYGMERFRREDMCEQQGFLPQQR